LGGQGQGGAGRPLFDWGGQARTVSHEIGPFFGNFPGTAAQTGIQYTKARALVLFGPQDERHTAPLPTSPKGRSVSRIPVNGIARRWMRANNRECRKEQTPPCARIGIKYLLRTNPCCPRKSSGDT